MSQESKDLAKKFIKFLNDKYPLKDDILVSFLGDRTGQMTTGSRSDEFGIKILTKGRLNRDILRTLAHEWIHEHQMTILKREIGQDIGGKNEDEANAGAGRLIKMFEKEHPEMVNIVYEGLKPISNRIDILTEQIVLLDKINIQKEFITEMKKIGIEKLPYSYSALKQFVDPETMDVHYNKHYKGYVKKLNDALSSRKGDIELEDIIKTITKFNTKVRNNAGGAFNHALFWKMLSPKKQTLKGDLLDKITNQYKSFKNFKEEFNKAALDSFGSGWVWLVLTKTNRLKIITTPNQDNPLMNDVNGGYPILGLDLWEHAYYLRYKNKRDQYINKFWNHINWEFVNSLYDLKTNKKETINESVDHKVKSALKWLNKEFGDLTPVVKYDKTFYVNKDRLPLFYYYELMGSENDLVYINYNRIWVFFEDIFGLYHSQIENILNVWLEQTYNLRGFTPVNFSRIQFTPLDESYNLETINESVDYKGKSALKWLNKKFGDLTPVVKDDKTFYVNKDRLPLFYYYHNGPTTGYIYINYKRIWVFFEDIFGLDHSQIEDILGIWLQDTYNLRDFTPVDFSRIKFDPLDENYNSETINEHFILSENKEVFPLTSKSFRSLINNAYPKCEGLKYTNGCLGKIETEQCKTDVGIIGGKYSEQNYGGNGNWSIINRFDTNSSVHKEIQKIWSEETNSTENFRKWIINNIGELVGDKGRFTERLVDINKNTILTGRENESYAKTVIINKFKLKPDEEGLTWNIIERCAGDVRDRKLGQDFDVIIDGTSYFVQVKPVDYSLIEKFGSERGYYYKVPSWHNHNKYKESNVDIILYVDRPKNKYIMFRNDYSRIQTVANPTTFPKFFVYYYENPIYTNMEFEVHIETEKIDAKPKLARNKENEIDYYKERIQYYKDKLGELGDSEYINEMIKFYNKKLYQIIN
jgi:Fe-Mn family superoxide dismutase